MIEGVSGNESKNMLVVTSHMRLRVGPYGIRSVSGFRGARRRHGVCVCVVCVCGVCLCVWYVSVRVCVCVESLKRPSSWNCSSLSRSLYPACTAEDKVNKQWRVGGQHSFTPKTKQCPHQTPPHTRTKARSRGC